jgi:acetylornithine deacetylase/succinyl-diaminopimelate desuccinylase-like protein
MIDGESPETVRNNIEDILKMLEKDVEDFLYTLSVTFSRSPLKISANNPFVTMVSQQIESTTGEKVRPCAVTHWTGCALPAEKGISAAVFGPKGHGVHSKTEWVDTDSILTTTKTLTEVARYFCGRPSL